MIGALIKSVFEFLKRNPMVVVRTAQALPAAVRHLSNWISRATYDEAAKNIAEIERHSEELLWEIFQTRKSEMSVGVRQRWEERLRKLGRLK